MAKFEISNGRWVGGDEPCFIIAEIGQNHQGEIKLAKEMIKMAKDCGCDCAKFQKNVLTQKFNKGALARPYTSKNSWGPTYGEHKAFLEFSTEDFKELKRYADEIGILFSSSCGDADSFDLLDSMGVQFFKIASPDSENMQLLKHAASKGKPLIISTGMRQFEEVKQIYDELKKITHNFCLLQCTSVYPLPNEEVHLNVLKSYKEEFSEVPIGYSGHERGTGISIAAVALGAKVLERHITLDKTWKGSDHSASLEAHELKDLVAQIRTVEKAIGSTHKRMRECEVPVYKKLGKTIVASRALKRGDAIKLDDMAVKVAEPNGMAAIKKSSVIGKTILRDIEEDESILESYLE